MPSRGEIWFSHMHTDPPDKAPRPVIVVSLEARNQSPRASTLLVVPLSTTPKRARTHVELRPGETGLNEVSIAKAEDISAVLKTSLSPPRLPLRRIGEHKLHEIALAVQTALGFPSPST